MILGIHVRCKQSIRLIQQFWVPKENARIVSCFRIWRHSPFWPFFCQPDRDLSIWHLGIVGVESRPRAEDTRSEATRLLPKPWATPHPLDIASTTAHVQKTPSPRQRACCPNHGRLPTRSDRYNLSRGDLHNNLPGWFERVFAAKTWGNWHCLYRRPRAENALKRFYWCNFTQ